MAKKLPFSACLSRLSKAAKLGSKPGLSRIAKLCMLLGNPQEKFKAIIVAGTNGKGSTTAMIASALRASGKKTGAYFSPHVFDFCERVQVNGRNIPENDFAICLSEVFSAIDGTSIFSGDAPTFFEILTAAAFLHFAKKKVDYAVLEVGMGGRLDATNIASAEICCIASISLDHVQYLGRTERLIAYEKAGIAKKGKFLVAANAVSGAALEKIKSECKKKKAVFTQPSKYDRRLANSARLRLHGEFQKGNAATAACASRLLGIDRKSIISGLSSATIPGRMQKLSSRPAVLADCAHNPQAAKTTSHEIEKFAPMPKGKRVLLFSSMADKDYPAFLRILRAHFDSIVVFRPPLLRAEKIGKLSAAAKKAGYCGIFSAQSPKKALSAAKAIAGKNGLVLACGSIYSFQFLFGSPKFYFAQ